MSDAYNIDFGSDDDVDIEESGEKDFAKETYPHFQDIEKLKEKTMELLDSSWKDSRNRQLLCKMLELEEPVITPKMVDFLLQDGVCELLLSFITQIGTGQPRPLPSEGGLETLRLSYKACYVLSSHEPSEAMLAFLSKKASLITRNIFEIFRDDSAGSFYHAYRIIECLLRCYPGDVYDGISGDGNGASRIESMLRYIGFSPVGELVLIIVSLSPLSRMNSMFVMSSKNRWQFYEQLSDWILLLRICEVIIHSQDLCRTDLYVDADMHSLAATQLLQELIEKLSLEDNGEILLQPLGYTPALLESLIDSCLGKSVSISSRRSSSSLKGDNQTDLAPDASLPKGSNVPLSRRKSSVRLLCFLLRRASEPQIVCISAGVGGAPTPIVTANRLYPLRNQILNRIGRRMTDLFNVLLTYDEDLQYSQSILTTSVIFTRKPAFTSLRILLVELMILMVENDDNISSFIPASLWRIMAGWVNTYHQNNIYHALFYRLVFAVLRQGHEAPQKTLFQKALFAEFLMDSFYLIKSKRDEAAEMGYDSKSDRMSCDSLGLLLNLTNVIRLQASCQSPLSFLRNFLNVLPKWSDFLSDVSESTKAMEQFGMGIRVVEYRQVNANSLSSLLLSENPNKDENSFGFDNLAGSDFGSRYAKSLGFPEGTLCWNDDGSDSATDLRSSKIIDKEDARKDFKTDYYEDDSEEDIGIDGDCSDDEDDNEDENEIKNEN